MSALFRGKFLDHLKNSFDDLIFPGGIGHLGRQQNFEIFRRRFEDAPVKC
jgi:hypothetical protein